MKKVLYIEGRPHGHPLHRKFGQRIHSTFIHVDFILRWHDRDSSAFRRYLSWLLCAVFLPRKRFDVIFSEGPHFIVGLQKWMHLLPRKKRTVALLDNETLYFIDTNYYPEKTTKALKKLILSYDGIISAGKMEADLAKKYAHKNAVVKQIFNGIEDARLAALLQLEPALSSSNIVFIGNVSGGWRAWYKGVDLLFQSFELAWQQRPQLRLFVIGSWDVGFFNTMTGLHCPQSKANVILTGYTTALDDYLKEASLYVHPARGEAWGISVTEAMAAGIMPLVSDWTGSREVVAKADASYVVELDPQKIAAKILWHFQQEQQYLRKQSQQCKQIAAAYSATASVQAFENAFNELTAELDAR